MERDFVFTSESVTEGHPDKIADQILDAIEQHYDRRRERLFGSGGQIISDLDNALSRANGLLSNNVLIQLLTLLPQGSRASFDKKTHRRVFQRTTRLTYIYYAAQLLEYREPEEIAQDVLAHLEQARAIIQQAWGATEWARIANSPIADLDVTTQNGLRAVLGEDAYLQAYNKPLLSLGSEIGENVVKELGRQAITEIYRQLLLQVITELWVDYLTQMEALRVSIGLEAYGQRDPLVQYKTRAFELFQNLLQDMRTGVVTRMFIYRPRDMSAVQTTVKRAEESLPEEVEEVLEAEPQTAEPAKKEEQLSQNKKRRRRRH